MYDRPSVIEATKCLQQAMDNEIEKLWCEFKDLKFIESKDDDRIDIYLVDDWYIFEAGTDRFEIWKWFDKQYSQGVTKLREKFE